MLRSLVNRNALQLVSPINHVNSIFPLAARKNIYFSNQFFHTHLFCLHNEEINNYGGSIFLQLSRKFSSETEKQPIQDQVAPLNGKTNKKETKTLGRRKLKPKNNKILEEKQMTNHESITNFLGNAFSVKPKETEAKSNSLEAEKQKLQEEKQELKKREAEKKKLEKDEKRRNYGHYKLYELKNEYDFEKMKKIYDQLKANQLVNHKTFQIIFQVILEALESSTGSEDAEAQPLIPLDLVNFFIKEYDNRGEFQTQDAHRLILKLLSNYDETFQMEKRFLNGRKMYPIGNFEYNVMIEHFSNFENYDKMEYYFNELLNSKTMQPDTNAWGIIIMKYGGDKNANKLKETLAQMKERNVSFDIHIYNAFLMIYSQMNKIKFDEIVLKIEEKKMVYNNVTLQILHHHYMNLKNQVQINALIDYMVENKIHNVAVWCSTIHYYIDKNNYSKVAELFKKLGKSMQSTDEEGFPLINGDEIFLNFIDFLENRSKIEELHFIYDQIKDITALFNLTATASLLRIFFELKSENLDEIMESIYEIAKKSSEIDSITINTYMKYLFEKKLYEKLVGVYSELYDSFSVTSKELVLSVHLWLIRAYFDTKSLPGIQMCFINLKKLEISPDAKCYNLLFQLCGQLDDLDTLLEHFETMIYSECIPTVETFNILFTYLPADHPKRPLINEAYEEFQRMRDTQGENSSPDAEDSGSDIDDILSDDDLEETELEEDEDENSEASPEAYEDTETLDKMLDSISKIGEALNIDAQLEALSDLENDPEYLEFEKEFSELFPEGLDDLDSDDELEEINK